MNGNQNASGPVVLPTERASVKFMNAQSEKERSLGLTCLVMGGVTIMSGVFLASFAMAKLPDPVLKDSLTFLPLKQLLSLYGPGTSLVTFGGLLFRFGRKRLNLATAWALYSANSQVCTENGMEQHLVDLSEKKASRDAAKIQASGIFAFLTALRTPTIK